MSNERANQVEEGKVTNFMEGHGPPRPGTGFSTYLVAIVGARRLQLPVEHGKICAQRRI